MSDNGDGSPPRMTGAEQLGRGLGYLFVIAVSYFAVIGFAAMTCKVFGWFCGAMDCF